MDKTASFPFKCCQSRRRPALDWRPGRSKMKQVTCGFAAAAISAAIAVVLTVPAAAADVKIGVIYPLTGNAASAGQSARDAVHLGVDIVNTAHPDLKNLPL